MKSVAILLASVVVIGLIGWVCFLPPHKLPDYVIGDARCDICGQEAVYSLRMEGRYLLGEYCRAHRWFGMVQAKPTSTLTTIVLCAAVFGVIYSILTLLGGARQREQDTGIAGGGTR